MSYPIGKIQSHVYENSISLPLSFFPYFYECDTRENVETFE